MSADDDGPGAGTPGPSEKVAATEQDHDERSAPGPQLRRRRHAAQRCPR